MLFLSHLFISLSGTDHHILQTLNIDQTHLVLSGMEESIHIHFLQTRHVLRPWLVGWLVAIHYMSRLVSPLRRYFLNFVCFMLVFWKQRRHCLSSWDGIWRWGTMTLFQDHMSYHSLTHIPEKTVILGDAEATMARQCLLSLVGCLSHRHRHHQHKPTTLDRSGLYMCNCLKSSAFVATSFVYRFSL